MIDFVLLAFAWKPFLCMDVECMAARMSFEDAKTCCSQANVNTSELEQTEVDK